MSEIVFVNIIRDKIDNMIFNNGNLINFVVLGTCTFIKFK